MNKVNRNIDMKETGRKIRELLRERNCKVRDLQEYLNLECPQSIYRWLQGKTLPSLQNLYAMSVFFDAKMDDIVTGINNAMISIDYGSEYKDEYFCDCRMNDYAIRIGQFI